MPSFRPVRLLLASAALGASAPLLAQRGVRITSLPPHLALPAPPGANPLLECEVLGAPSAVWLAPADAAQGPEARVPLTSVGGDRWQLNLADLRVGRLAQRADVEALRVVATLGGKDVASEPIRFARASTTPGEVRVAAALAKVAAPRALSSAADDWLRPGAVERLTVETAARDVAVVAHLGGTDRPLQRAGRTGAFSLPVDAALAEAWQQAGVLELVLQARGGSTVVARLRAVPDRLLLQRGGETVTIVQRRSAEVPGSRGFLRVQLGDITAGAVLLTVRGADGEDVVAQRLVRERDRVLFELAGGTFALVVDRLENLLIGDDFAVLRAVDAASLPRDLVTELLHCIESSDATFVRGTVEFGGRQAGIHVRKKLAALGREPSVDEFVDTVASTSSTTGEPYRVRLPDGSEQTMREWLRAQRARLEASRPEDGGARGEAGR